jgi:EmrB/QacA subfamily drug resistance transporter
MVANAQEPQSNNSEPDHTGRWVLLSTIMASSMGFISGSALNVALPALQQALDAKGPDILWITSGYLLLLASLILVGGSLGDHYGRRRIFGYGIWLFTLGSIACGLSPTVELLIAARVVQGIGGAMMIPGSLAIISSYFDDSERGGAIGLWGAFTSATTVGGPIIGGFLADAELWAGLPFIPAGLAAAMWRGIFFINLPLAVIALYALYSHVPESRDEEAKNLDVIGSVLATLGLAGVTYGFIQAGRMDDNGVLQGFNAANLTALVVGAMILVIFVIWEWRSSHPMMPLSLYKSPVFSGANLLTLALYAGLQGSLFFFSLNLIQVQGYPERLAGFASLPFSILLILMSRRSGKLADQLGPRIPLTVGPAIVGVGFALLAWPGLTSGPVAYWWTYFPGMLTVGIGMGITVAPLTTAVMSSVPQHQSGTASGINNAASRTAGVLAISILGAVAILQFGTALDGNIADIGLSDANRGALLAQTSELGNAQVPEGVPAEQRDATQRAIHLAFVAVFRMAMWVGAVLAWASALFAWFTMRVKPAEARARVEEGLTEELASSAPSA